eukprot:Rmarinus@m.7074
MSSVKLKFLLPDGRNTTQEFSTNQTLADVKSFLLSNWPEDFPSCGGADELRIIHQGRILVGDNLVLKDTKVAGTNLPVVPVHLVIRPAEAKEPAVKLHGTAGKTPRTCCVIS